MTKDNFSYPYMVFGKIRIAKSEFNKLLEEVLEENSGQIIIASDIAEQMSSLGSSHGVEFNKFTPIIGKALIKKKFKTGISPHGRYYLIPEDYVA